MQAKKARLVSTPAALDGGPSLIEQAKKLLSKISKGKGKDGSAQRVDLLLHSASTSGMVILTPEYCPE